jgi:hypothetical protein
MPVKIEISGMTAHETLGELAGFANGLVRTDEPVDDERERLNKLTDQPGIQGAIGPINASRAEYRPDATASEAGDQQPATETATAAAEPAKRGRGRPKKPAEAAPAAAPAAPPIPASAIDAAIARSNAAEDPQDAADEAAESAATAPAQLTHDDVRNKMGEYLKKYGMEAAQADGKEILGVGKISDLPDDQDVLAKAVAAIATAIESNPKGRAAVS